MTITTPLLRKAEGIANLLSDNAGIKKGDTIFHVQRYGHDRDTGHIRVRIRKLTVESFGKKKGTASDSEGMIHRNLNPTFDIFARNIEDAREMAATVGNYESARAIESSLRCDRSWITNYASDAKREVVAKCEARIAKFESASPSFSIIIED